MATGQRLGVCPNLTVTSPPRFRPHVPQTAREAVGLAIHQTLAHLVTAFQTYLEAARALAGEAGLALPEPGAAPVVRSPPMLRKLVSLRQGATVAASCADFFRVAFPLLLRLQPPPDVPEAASAVVRALGDTGRLRAVACLPKAGASLVHSALRLLSEYYAATISPGPMYEGDSVGVSPLQTR